MKKKTSRSGMAAVIAMMYLCLFSVLAVGLYATSNASLCASDNERRSAEALLASESGMSFLRRQLADIEIPHGTPQNAVYTMFYQQLAAQLNNTVNLHGNSVTYSGSTIRIPGGNENYISLQSGGSKFNATIVNQGQGVLVSVTGRATDKSLRRTVQLKYNLAQKASAIFDYGVASRGKISTAGSSQIVGATDPTKGSLLSTCMTDGQPVVVNGSIVSGDISITNPAGTVPYGSNVSIGGQTVASEIAKHIHKGVVAPEFPTVDTSMFISYATSVYSHGMTTLNNCRIPANTNPRFNGNMTIKGVLYIETPNVVDFRGNVNIQGVIVGPTNPTGDVNTNAITFGGSVAAQGVDTLGVTYGSLRQLTGSFILAPKFNLAFTGDFGTVNGSMICSKFSMTGNATGTVKGSIINLEDVPMTISGSSSVIIASTGTTNYPSGVFFDSQYVPLQDTYEEATE